MKVGRGCIAALLALAGMVARAGEPVDVNQADQASLESVRGIGTALSARLLDERKHGPFRDWADLIARVPGVGAGSAARLSAAGLRVGAVPYAGAAAASAASR